MKSIIAISFLMLLSACSSAPSGTDNSAERNCLQKGGKMTYEKQLFGSTGYCRLPDGSWIEAWRLYLKDHVLP